LALSLKRKKLAPAGKGRHQPQKKGEKRKPRNAKKIRQFKKKKARILNAAEGGEKRRIKRLPRKKNNPKIAGTVPEKEQIFERREKRRKRSSPM